MAKINSLFRDMSIRKTFVSYVLITLLVALILSGLTIWGCLATQNWLLPEKEKAVLSINAKSEDGSEEQQMTMVLRQGEELPFLVPTLLIESRTVIKVLHPNAKLYMWLLLWL